MPGPTATSSLPTLIERLNRKYPDARYELNYETPFQLLIATILAAQATDERINQVTPGLFAKYPDARAFAEADRAELEQDLRPTGFYRNKARAVQECSRALVERFGGEVPACMDDLVTLPGVARKTANVVLNNAFRIPSGVIVDTHVARVSQRMGLSKQTKPDKIEQDLMRLVPIEEWVQFGPAMVLHGRYTCTFHNPKCGECLFNDFCPRIGVEADGETVREDGDDEPVAEAVSAAPAAAADGAPSLAEQLPADWRAALKDELSQPYVRDLERFVAAERAEHVVFPPAEDVFNAFRMTPFDEVKVLLLGQDPYHDDGQAHGLCFSVRRGVKPPPSLVNIFKELQDDLGVPPPDHGCLEAWARQGVMLLNAVLTVRAHQPASHKERGWERFTDAVIRALSARERPTVFLLWGAYAHKKEELIDRSRHIVLKAAHPSPLSAKKFFGSRPFSQTNQALERLGRTPVDWRLSDAPPPKTPPPPPRPEPRAEPTPPPAPEPPPVAAIALPHVPSSKYASLLPDDWRALLAAEFGRPYFRKLEKFLDAERNAHPVCPRESELFATFALTPYERVKVAFIGDEPPADEADADGPAFTDRKGRRALFQELKSDLGNWVPRDGSLAPWARQGVLLLPSVLTVRAGQPGSHRNQGWETFTDAVVRLLNERERPLVFLLLGEAGQRKERLIDADKHGVVIVPGPTARAFRGSRPFSRVNEALQRRRQGTLAWQLYTP